MPGTPGPKRAISEYLYHASDDSLVWQGSRIVNAPSDALWIGAPSLSDNNIKRYFFFEEDCLMQSSATALNGTTWTTTKGTGGTNAFQNVAGGVYNLVTAGSNDDYMSIHTTAKNWLFASGKEHWLEAAFTVNEAQTNLSSWSVGWMDTFTTGGLQAGAAGPLANFSGAVVYKAQGGMAVKCLTSNGATQSTPATIATAVTNQKIRVGMYFDGTATTGNVYPFVDIGDGNGFVAGGVQTITLSGLNAMSLNVCVKAGASGTTAETLQLDYIACLALR
jgi:hypothetical protein